MLKRVSCGGLEAGKHSDYLCLTLTHFPFIYLSFLKSEWNSSLVSSLSDCQTFQWSHLKVSFFFFFQHVGNFHYFGAAVTFGIPGSFSLPFLVPPEETQKHKHLRRVSASSHLLAQKMEATCGLQEQVLCSGTSPRAWRAGWKKQGLILSFRLFGSPWKTRRSCEWRARSETDMESRAGVCFQSPVFYTFSFSFWAIHSFRLGFISLMYLESVKYYLFKG